MVVTRQNCTIVMIYTDYGAGRLVEECDAARLGELFLGAWEPYMLAVMRAESCGNSMNEALMGFEIGIPRRGKAPLPPDVVAYLKSISAVNTLTEVRLLLEALQNAQRHVANIAANNH